MSTMIVRRHVRSRCRVLVAMTLATLGCSQPQLAQQMASDPPARSDQAAQPAQSVPRGCTMPLTELCRDCPSYDQALADVEKDCAAEKAKASGRHGRTGTCGAYRTISRGDSFVDTTYYYNGEGRLVGARLSSENIHNACQGERQYGLAVACERKPGRTICG